MFRWRNGGVRGAKIGTSSRILSADQPRGRGNGGIIGNRRIDSNLDNNVNKTSGIWDIDGITLVSHNVTTTETVDNSYYEYPPPYEDFAETSRSYLGGGYRWFPGADATNCGMPTWPDGDMGGHSGSNLQRTWTQVGSVNCSGWIFDVYQVNGYYYTVYPAPIYHEVIENIQVTNTYSVWNYF